MKQKIKQIWTTALRSGLFKQETGALRKRKSTPQSEQELLYCCLGVLCEVYRQETGKGKWQEAMGDLDNFVTKSEGRSGVPPEAVRDWAELTDPGKIHHLARLNDEKRFNFSRIADYIDENL